MLVNKADDIKSSEITDKNQFLNRRNFIRGAVLAATTTGTGLLYRQLTSTTRKPAPDGQPAVEESAKEIREFGGEKLTSYEDITNYNNFYEFSTDKRGVAPKSANFVTRPWASS
jgi:sulfoxide reductase catalytic subunit YedY